MKDSAQSPTMRWQTSATQAAVLVLTGAWTLHTQKPNIFQVLATQTLAEKQIVSLDISAVTAWDSSLLVAIRQLLQWAKQQRLELDSSQLPEDITRLLGMADTPSVQVQAQKKFKLGFVAGVGQSFLNATDAVRNSCIFLGETLISLGRMCRGKACVRASDFWWALQQCGPSALPIVALIAGLVGLILAFVGAFQLQAFGAQLYISNMVAIGMTREMGALMTAVIMAGRTGAAYAAELGSMQANEEVDALKTFGFPPLEFLVMPRLLALMVSMPILVLFADVIGILGGFVIGAGLFDISATQYINQSIAMLSITDVLIGVFKGFVFAILIGLIGCYYGLNCGRNAQAVGKATTQAVVSIIVALVVSDATITLILTQLGI
ncbi:ABC transporter permease [Pseudomonas sp. F1_0610]|uniref:ABC transporter permease n=1 Tax=Pseudomonas sp. F1_0610 TaxID=3114284 RepID=UPI0039C34499